MKLINLVRFFPAFSKGASGPQMLKVVKLTFFLLTAAFLQLSAKSFSQKISYSGKDVPITKVFASIEQQTGYVFFYNNSDLELSMPVTLNLKDVPLTVALDECFKDQPLQYVLKASTIFITVKNIRLLVSAGVDTARPTFINVSGRISDEKAILMNGATLKVKGTNIMYVVSSVFSLVVPAPKAVLVFSFVGYKTQEIMVHGPVAELVISMVPDTAKMKDVEVVSNGYQTISKERATGSFEKVNNSLFNRTVGPTVLDRLEGTVPGILFDKRQLPSGNPGLNQLVIRGQSTLESNKNPLIVLDNVPYNGDVNNINPNDVESITILKDAAAASIWGVRAGNGVVVIITKKGSFDKPLQVSLNSNVTVVDKPNLFDTKTMSTSDFIDVEKYLFSQGNYDYALGDTYTWSPVTQVVDLLGQARAGTISQATADAQIETFRGHDVRNDYLKYVYRRSVSQQYALNLSGGSKTVSYLISGGYDRQLQNTIANSNDRITLRSDISFKPAKNWEIHTNTIFTQGRLMQPGQDLNQYLSYTPGQMAPYTSLKDAQGNPAVITRNYRAAFAANPGDSRLLNWQFRPLGELGQSSNRGNNYDVVINLGTSYQFNKAISASVTYNYQRTIGETDDYESVGSYFMRNIINLYTQAPGSLIERPVPLGGFLSTLHSNATNHVLRGGLNVDKRWGDRHQLTAIAGAEVNEISYTDNTHYTYGYDQNTQASQPVDNVDYYPAYTLPQGGGGIGNGMGFTSTDYRYTALYANAAYTYNNKYTLTGSARKDASNLFGVTPNKRGVPLWSAGGLWSIDKEPFYKLDGLPLLKFRATYGYNGNTNNNLSALSSIGLRSGAPYTNLPYATILFPANNNLRWEKVGILNLGLDFGLRDNRISGKIEYFVKNSTDLLWQVPVGESTGFTYATTNSVSLKGKGIELGLHSINLRGAFKWTTDFSFTYNAGKVTKYNPLNVPAAGDYLSAQSTINPIVGRPLYSVYSYKWAGLDPQTGDPRGYVQGKVSNDYITMNYDSVQNLQYNGSALPLIYGNFTNTISWKNISVSANIIYKMDYYFNRGSINYGSLMNTFSATGHSDYAKRWQKPGDEKFTNVPSMVYPDNYYRDAFYANSATLITKGDYIRLQDIVAAYSLTKSPRYFKNIRLQVNVSNLGIIWRANKQGIDPEYGSGYFPPAPKAYTVGLSANF